MYCHVFRILLISLASPKTLVAQHLLFKTSTGFLQYLRDAFNHVCVFAERKGRQSSESWAQMFC